MIKIELDLIFHSHSNHGFDQRKFDYLHEFSDNENIDCSHLLLAKLI